MAYFKAQQTQCPGIHPGTAFTFFVRNHADGFHLVGCFTKRRNTTDWGFISCRTNVSSLWLKLPWERVIIQWRRPLRHHHGKIKHAAWQCSNNRTSHLWNSQQTPVKEVNGAWLVTFTITETEKSKRHRSEKYSRKKKSSEVTLFYCIR